VIGLDTNVLARYFVEEADADAATQRGEQPQQGVHEGRGRRVLWLLPRPRRRAVGPSARPHQLLAQGGQGFLLGPLHGHWVYL
jgi:hypothetical protein